MGNKISKEMLAVRFGHMGDVLLATGVLHYLGTQHSCTIDVLTRKKWAPIFENHPYVRKVWSAEEEQLLQPQLFPYYKSIRASYGSTTGLLDLHGNLRSTLLRFMWQGPAHTYKKYSLQRRLFVSTKGRFFGDILQKYSVPERYYLAVDKNVPLGKELLPCLFLTELEQEKAKQTLQDIHFLETRPVAIHPFATYAAKTWPAEVWVDLTRKLDILSIPWVAIGKGKDMFDSAPQSFINKTNLRETAALLAHCRVLITGDSGPMHLARAVKTKVVGLFGPTTKEFGFYPTKAEGVVIEGVFPCRPCSLHGAGICRLDGKCLRDISLKQVIDAALAYE